MTTMPEYIPSHYLLQIRETTCQCGATETSSQLWLVERHYLKENGTTRRREAHVIDYRLPRGSSTKKMHVPTCTKCFTPYEPVYTCRDQDLVCIQPGPPSKANGYAGLTLEDL